MEPEVHSLVEQESVKPLVKAKLKSSGAEAKAANSKSNNVQEALMDDYIEIKRADLNLVMYNEIDLNEMIFTVVKALQNVSRVRFYGVSLLTDVLRGSQKYNIFVWIRWS